MAPFFKLYKFVIHKTLHTSTVIHKTSQRPLFQNDWLRNSYPLMGGKIPQKFMGFFLTAIFNVAEKLHMMYIKRTYICFIFVRGSRAII